MKKIPVKASALLSSVFSVSALSLAVSTVVHAQEVDIQPADSQLEEMMVLGRLKSASQDRIAERMGSEIAVDILDDEQITRIGDSTAAVALKRVPGVTLVDGKYVYVRGLGERNSSTLLNGASVPSPDLTRNVLPLDIFPASIIKSIQVQKAYSPNMPATFGGGSIDIRTKGMPEEAVLYVEISGGSNNQSTDGYSYEGGGDDSWGKDDGTRALPASIENGLQSYFPSTTAAEPSLTPGSIQSTYERSGQEVSPEQAAVINAQMAADVYRDLNISNESYSLPDTGFSVGAGNAFDFGTNFTFGVLAAFDYDTSSRTHSAVLRTYTDPEDEFSDGTRTTHNVSMTGNLNFGMSWGDDHTIQSKNIYLRNTDDDVMISRRFNTTAPFSSGQGFIDYDYRYEQREMEVYQVTGEHRLGYDTKELLNIDFAWLDDLQLTWFYSDSNAKTDIPSETNIEASITRDRDTDMVTANSLVRKQRTMDLRYSDLSDDLESSGFELKLPLVTESWEINLSGGGKYDRKTRIYEQLDLSIGAGSSAADPSLAGGAEDLTTIFSDQNILNTDYEYEIIYQDGLSRSYLASTTTDAFYGNIDLFWDHKLRIVMGARYEEYKQFSGAYFPYRVKGARVDIGDLSGLGTDELPSSIFYLDDIYPSLAVTYSIQDFWAEDFQLRFSASETVVLPDLREIAPASYQDPLTGYIVSGNPDATHSEFSNLDLRAEWFFSSGDNFTVSLFHKAIDNPIEYFLDTGTEDSLNATIENAESGEISGIELEWLSTLGNFSDSMDAFFVSGNVTVLDSELIVGDEIEVSVTNRVRPLQGASEYVGNIQFGFDSPNGEHAATLVYNVFGERVYSAGVGDLPDAYEQPFSALDFSYSYFPTENWTVKLKARNLLNEKLVIQQGEIDVYEQEIGTSFSLAVKFSY